MVDQELTRVLSERSTESFWKNKHCIYGSSSLADADTSHKQKIYASAVDDGLS